MSANPRRPDQWPTAGQIGHAGQPAPTRVLVAVLCQDLERTIGSIVVQASRWASEVIVIDDGSRDGTSLIAEAAGAIVVRHESNQGKGAAMNSAFAVALGREADVLVVMDGDGQHKASEIPIVARPVVAGDADISVGSRHLTQGDGEIPAVRRVGQTVVTTATNLGSGVQVTDSQSGFRAFSRRALESMTFSSRGFAVESEMQFLALDRDLRVVEVPIEGIDHHPPWQDDEPVDERLLTVREPTGAKGVPAPQWFKRLVAKL
jgi:glycosyltransferase involved in cell wall biosynthesis